MGCMQLVGGRVARRTAIAWLAATLLPLAALAEPWAPGQGPPPGLQLPSAAEAKQLEQLRQQGESEGLRQRYLRSAHQLLHRFWSSREQPKLLFAGDKAEGCGVKQVAHPMAYYCPPSKELAMALNLRRSVSSAKGKSDRELLLLDLAVLAHEWGHHVNQEQGRGPFKGGMNLTVKPEELAACLVTPIYRAHTLIRVIIDVRCFCQKKTNTK